MHLLFLCSQNKRRSLTAEKLFNGYESHDARSAGTENNSRVKVTPDFLGGRTLYSVWKRNISEESRSDTQTL